MVHSNAHAYILESLRPNQSYNEAINLIKSKICNKNDDCDKCLSIEKNINPNMAQINGYEEKITIDKVEAIKDFCFTTSFNQDYKIIIIQGIENITRKAANTFLKFIEEPELDIIIVFTTMNTNSVLETIQTRCEIIRLNTYIEEDELNDNLNLLLEGQMFKIEWNKMERTEIKNLLILYSQNKKLKSNEMHLQKILELINMLKANVNTNLVISQLINDTKLGVYND